LKNYISSGTDQTPAEQIQAGGNILSSEIQKLINYRWNKQLMPPRWKENNILPIYKKADERISTSEVNY
jgi:hypothetical protein